MKRSRLSFFSRGIFTRRKSQTLFIESKKRCKGRKPRRFSLKRALHWQPSENNTHTHEMFSFLRNKPPPRFCIKTPLKAHTVWASEAAAQRASVWCRTEEFVRSAVERPLSDLLWPLLAKHKRCIINGPHMSVGSAQRHADDNSGVRRQPLILSFSTSTTHADREQR